LGNDPDSTAQAPLSQVQFFGRLTPIPKNSLENSVRALETELPISTGFTLLINYVLYFKLVTNKVVSVPT